MRIAICTRLRIPIFICNRANSSSFASCGMRQSCVQMPKTSLWYDKMSTGMQLRPQNQGTKGHQHTVGRRIESPIMICLFVLSSKKKNFLHLLTDLSNLYPSTQKHISISHSHKHTGEMSLRHILRGWWRTFSWSTTQYEEEDIQYRSWEERRAGGVTHTSRCLPQQHHRTEICHWSRAPSTPTIDIH